jgi:hypothetical protein
MPRLSGSPPLVIDISPYHQNSATLPSVESCERFEHHQIDLQCTPITGANPDFQGCHIQLELWVQGSSLTMNPLGMEGVEPSTARRKFNSGLSCQRTSHVGPLERFGHGFVEILHKGSQALAELRHRGETGPFEQAPHEDTAPDVHLLQPGRMLGGIHQANAMRRILPACGSGGPGLSDARFPVDAQLRVNPTRVRH